MIELNAEGIAKAHVLLSHIENGASKAISAALNRTVDGVKTDVTRKVAETYDIKAKDVRASLKAQKSTMATLNASVSGKGSPIPLIKFRVTPNKLGQQRTGTVLRASAKRSGGKPIPGAFLAQFKSAHIGVMQRVGKNRLPVKELYGPAVPQMMSENKVRQYVMDGANDRFEKRLDHEIERLLNKG
ncbi:MAG: hypothetical protein H6Q73_1816 [Firmicutes bacterium]|nr:hypothetical protein [Bacillota bacterium]